MAKLHTEYTKESFECRPRSGLSVAKVARVVEDATGSGLIAFFFGMQNGARLLRVEWMTSREEPRVGVREALLPFVRDPEQP